MSQNTTCNNPKCPVKEVCAKYGTEAKPKTNLVTYQWQIIGGYKACTHFTTKNR